MQFVIITSFNLPKNSHLKSTDEVKNNCYLFERLFKVKKNGIFLFGIQSNLDYPDSSGPR